DELTGVDPRETIVDLSDPIRQKRIDPGTASNDLLVPVVRGGQVVAGEESLDAIRSRAQSELAQLHPTIRRLLNPHEYPVGLDIGLHERRNEMILATRSKGS